MVCEQVRTHFNVLACFGGETCIRGCIRGEYLYVHYEKLIIVSKVSKGILSKKRPFRLLKIIKYLIPGNEGNLAISDILKTKEHATRVGVLKRGFAQNGIV